jgi:gluconate 2-dehydrogenase gamma chain
MADPLDDVGSGLTRREWLKHAGIAGAAAAVAPIGLLSPAGAISRSPQGDPLENLTGPEAATLDAIVARLIPTDEHGPGAREARAARYIDRALGGALASSRDAYRSGLAAMDAHAQRAKGGLFAALSAGDQDDVLRDMERNAATGFTPNSAVFFTLLRTHTWQGMFGDPYYGGNASFVGWDLLGYPGLRLAVSASDQRLDANLTPVRTSAYDLGMFSPKPARAGLIRLIRHHGD